MVHRPRKRFGQHFLHDAGTIRRIVDAIAPTPDDIMVEIGPGLGAITQPLLARLGRMQVIELDRDLIPRLVARCTGMGDLKVYQGDALTFDYAGLAANQGALRVVGNLPYNISTPLIFRLLECAHAIQDMFFLLQRELVDRIRAAPGSGDYGRLSVMVQYRCRCERLFRVANHAFFPPPKVESALLRLVPYRRLPVAVGDERRFARVVRQAFSQPRKTIRNNLKGLLDVADIKTAGIDPSLRPERLSLAEFAALARADRTFTPAHPKS